IPGVSATNLGVLKQFVAPAPSQCGASTANCPVATIGATQIQGAVAVGGVAVPVGVLPINAPNFSNTKTFVVAGDYDFRSNDRLSVRDIYHQTSAIDISAELPIFFTPLPTTNHFATIQETHTFTPAVLNEFRLGFHRTTNFITTGNFNFPGLDVFPNI